MPQMSTNMSLAQTLVALFCLALFAMPGATVSFAGSHSQTKIAVIGTGDLGSAMGLSFAKAGYDVTFGSRTPESDEVKELVDGSSAKLRAASQTDAVMDADIVFLSVPWPAMEQVAQSLGGLSGKVVIDVSWPMQQAADGYMESMVATSSAEMIQSWNPDAKVVKIGAPGSYLFREPNNLGDKITVFVAADDNGAKQTAAEVLFSVGLRPLDVGPLRHAREIEGMGFLYMAPLLQGRKVGWEYSVSPSAFWPCVWDMSESYGPVQDADSLTTFPQDGEAPTCP